MSELQSINNAIKSRLPHTTQRIVNALGWDASLRWLRLHGGRKVYFPDPQKKHGNYRDRHKLFNGLNQEQVSALLGEFGGQYIDLPTYRKLLASERNNLICGDFKRGLSIDLIAEKYNISKTAVHNIVHRFTVSP